MKYIIYGMVGSSLIAFVLSRHNFEFSEIFCVIILWILTYAMWGEK